jgi:uncharacterized membrane protein YgcG
MGVGEIVMTPIHRFGAIAALLCAATIAPAQADTTAGTVVGGFAEIANNVSGAMPGQKPAPKQLKSPAHFGERVQTEAGSKANISFIDGSHVLLGEKAELMIDSFVFDPKTGVEQASYQLAAGALRLVSGAIKKDKLKILTPTAAIAVRGTNLKIRVLASGETLVVVNRGQVEITSRRTGATASMGAGQSVTCDNQGLSEISSSEPEVEDGFVDDQALDGEPDLADVGLGELGFSDAEANEIESAVAAAESEGDSDGSDGGDSEGGDSGDGGDSGGGDSGGGDSGGGGDGGGGSD